MFTSNVGMTKWFHFACILKASNEHKQENTRRDVCSPQKSSACLKHICKKNDKWDTFEWHMNMFKYALLCTAPEEGGGCLFNKRAQRGAGILYANIASSIITHAASLLCRPASRCMTIQCKEEHGTIFTLVWFHNSCANRILRRCADQRILWMN